MLPDGVSVTRGFVRGARDDPRAADRPRAAAAAAASAAAAAAADEAGDGGDDDGDSGGGGGAGGARGALAGEQALPLCNERFLVPEALFHPQIVGCAQGGVCEAILAAISASPRDLQPLLWARVILAGGAASCPGFAARVEAELRPLAPEGCDLNVVCPASPGCCAWRGAAAFAASPAFGAAALDRRAWFAEGGARRAHPHPGATPRPLPGRAGY